MGSLTETLYEKLCAYGESDYYGFHMPGHKRNARFAQKYLPYQIDITEIDGFDDLHHAEGILKDMQKRASRLYHCGETHFLINGSTGGILSAVLGCTKLKDKVLLARNCHKSVYHAVYLNHLKPVYVYPEFLQKEQISGEVRADDIRRILEQEKDIRAVIIVSPTYDGVVSNVEEIAEAVHEKEIPLIVDEAHGAHFGFGGGFPENSNVLGADVVIHSLHKTLPSMTQTALLHMNGNLIRRERIREYLHMLQSSSPSYVLMASIDNCMEILEIQGSEMFNRYADRLRQFRNDMKDLRHIKLIQTENFDPSKLIISTAGTDISGRELSALLLEKYHLQMEMQANSYVLAMTSFCDTEEGYNRLKKALHEIDSTLKGSDMRYKQSMTDTLPRLEVVYSSREAEEKADEFGSEQLAWESCYQRISLEYAYLYPPGIPFIVPGEKIDQPAINCLKNCLNAGFHIEGLQTKGKIKVLKEERI